MSGERSLILVGASVRSAAQSAEQAGFSVVGVDLFGDTDTLAACAEYHRLNTTDSLKTLDDQLPSVPVIHVGGFQREQPVLEALAQNRLILGPSAQLRRKLINPRFLRQIAKPSGLKFPDFDESQPLTNCQGSASKARVLIKQSEFSGGLGIRWAASEVRRNPEGEFASFGSLGSDTYYQRWIAGRRLGATLLSDGVHTVVLGVCRSAITRKGQAPFVYTGSAGPLVDLPDSLAESLGKLGRVLAGEGLRGLLNVDLILDHEHGGWLLEVNPRWSGSSELIERSLRRRGLIPQGQSLIGLAYEATNGPAGSLRDWIKDFDGGGHLARRSNGTFLKRIVFARKVLRFDQQRFQSIVRDMNREGIEIELCDLPSTGSLVQKGTPVLSLIARLPETVHGVHRARERWRKLCYQISVGA